MFMEVYKYLKLYANKLDKLSQFVTTYMFIFT